MSDLYSGFMMSLYDLKESKHRCCDRTDVVVQVSRVRGYVIACRCSCSESRAHSVGVRAGGAAKPSVFTLQRPAVGVPCVPSGLSLTDMFCLHSVVFLMIATVYTFYFPVQI
jgi:hypothetical protein